MLTHLALVAIVGALPDAVAPIIAGTIYLPLWPLSEIGIPVFSPAESGGWPGPNVLGWLVFVAIWSLLWWLLVAVIIRVRS